MKSNSLTFRRALVAGLAVAAWLVSQVRPYALFPSLKTGLFGIGGEMVLAGWE